MSFHRIVFVIIICLVTGCFGGHRSSRDARPGESICPNIRIQYGDIKGHLVSVSLLTVEGRDSIDLKGLAIFHIKKGLREVDYGHGYLDFGGFGTHPKRIKAVRDTTIYPDYIDVLEGTMLSYDNPFYFADVDFDGKDEFIIVRKDWNGIGGTWFDVYEMNGKERTDMPIGDINGLTTFDKEAGIISHIVPGGRFGGSLERIYKYKGKGQFALTDSIETRLELRDSLKLNDGIDSLVSHYQIIDGQAILKEKLVIPLDVL